MYARSSDFRGDPQTIDDAIAYVRDEVMPTVTAMSGCVGLSMLCNRDTGRCIATTSWADESSMRMSEQGVQELRARMAEIFRGDYEVQEWEIGLLHRLHEAPDGACTRVTWARGNPADMDRMLDTFKVGMLPRVEELSGFCSVSFFINRQTGVAATAATYASRDAMQRASETVGPMREQFSREMGAEITEVDEFDLVLAHLRVPETV
jgi:quinol monooxygenase YgiN